MVANQENLVAVLANLANQGKSIRTEIKITRQTRRGCD
jgi:hypothetical protein